MAVDLNEIWAGVRDIDFSLGIRYGRKTEYDVIAVTSEKNHNSLTGYRRFKVGGVWNDGDLWRCHLNFNIETVTSQGFKTSGEAKAWAIGYCERRISEAKKKVRK